jgi:hypothetical protein
MPVEHGIRFELRFAEETRESARFRLSLRVANAEWAGEAEIAGSGGAIRFHFSDAVQPPEWCLGIVRANLRTLFRERSARGGYPARVARWRPAPRTAEGESS